MIKLFGFCRGSLGFGEEALQSLLGNVGRQVNIYIYIYAWFFSLLFVLDIYVWWLLIIVLVDLTGMTAVAVVFIRIHLYEVLERYTLYIKLVRLAFAWKLTSASWWTSQDVGDVLAALDYVIENGMADPAKVAVLGGSHGGFLASHLIGQVKASYNYGHIFVLGFSAFLKYLVVMYPQYRIPIWRLQYLFTSYCQVKGTVWCTLPIAMVPRVGARF